MSLKSPPSNIFFKYSSYIWIFIKYFLEEAIVERRRLLVHNRSSGTWAWNSSLEAETSPTLDFLLISEKYGFQITSIPSTIDLVRGKTTSSKLCSALPKYMILPAMPDNKAFSSCVVKRPLQFLQLRLLHKAVITVYLQMGCVHMWTIKSTSCANIYLHTVEIKKYFKQFQIKLVAHTPDRW